jgi:hypothetical protein
MTPDEKIAFWQYVQECRSSNRDSQREGQAMMNALRNVAPILYNMVTGTLADCFYDNDRIPAFREMVGV